MKIKKIQLINYMLLLSFLFTGCQKDELLEDTSTSLNQERILRTVSTAEVKESYESNFMARGAENWHKPYFQYSDSLTISDSDEIIRINPVVEKTKKAYSRMFSIEINGKLESVLYHMIPEEGSSTYLFNGWSYVSSLDGKVNSVFEVSESMFVRYFDVTDLNVNMDDLLTTYTGGSGVPEVDGGDLDPVVIVSPPPNHNFLLIFDPPRGGSLSNGGDFSGGNDSGGNTTGGGGSNSGDSNSGDSDGDNDPNQPICPPGQILDENLNCVDAPDEDGEEDICDQIEDLIDDQDFKDRMEELNGLTDGNFERGYTMTRNADGSFSYSDPFNGAPNSGQVSVTVNGPISGFIHNHNAGDGMLSIFSLGDIVDNLGFWHENGYIDNTDTFVFGVVTFGGTYLLSISDAGDFSAFMSDYVGAENIYEYQYDALINDGKTAIENEIGLISFLNLNNTGLTLYKGNTDDFNQWNRAVQYGGHVNTIQNCN